MPYLKSIDGGVELNIKVVPGASRSRIVGPLGDALKVQVAAVPEKGRANGAVIALIARILRVSPKQVSIIRGHTQPRKTLHVAGLTAADAEACLANA